MLLDLKSTLCFHCICAIFWRQRHVCCLKVKVVVENEDVLAEFFTPCKHENNVVLTHFLFQILLLTSSVVFDSFLASSPLGEVKSKVNSGFGGWR